MSSDTLPWTGRDDALLVSVRLTPRGGRDALDGIETLADGKTVLKARVRAAAENNEANAALCSLLADAAGVSNGAVTLAQGHRARIKTVRIAGEAARLAAILAERLAASAQLQTSKRTA